MTTEMELVQRIRDLEEESEPFQTRLDAIANLALPEEKEEDEDEGEGGDCNAPR